MKLCGWLTSKHHGGGCVMKTSRVFKGLALSAALWAVPVSAVPTIYTDQAAFLAALNGPVTLEDFNDDTLAAGLTIDSDAGDRQGNHYEDRLTRRGGETTSFIFANPVNGVGGFINLSPGGLGQGIRFHVNSGSTYIGQLLLIPGNRFWGVISDTAFSDIRLSAGQGFGSAETYHLDNVSFGTLAAGVPEPSMWAFMILGFGAIGAAMRRSRNTGINSKARFAV